MMIALIGFNANAAIYMIGDAPMGGWGYDGSAGIEMTDNGNGTYSTVVTIGTADAPKTVYFAFADGWGNSWDDFNANYRYGPQNGGQQLNGNWASVGKYGDRSFTFTGTGDDYVVTFDLTNLQAKIEGNVAPIEITTYSVVGNFNNWNVNSTDDIMTLVDGVYTLNRTNVELQARTFEYKIIGNHDYGIYEYPVGMNNNLTDTTVAKHGYYNIAITFVPETQAVTCTLTLVEEIIDEEDPIYTVTGSSAALFGAEWNDALLLEQNEMTKGQDGIYTWTKNNVELTAGNIEFKVVLGHAWGTEYPSSNYVATIAEDGTYDVAITFNPADQAITFTATASVPVEDFYTVAGAPASLFGAEWDAEYAANNMTLADGIYTWSKDSVELAAETFIEFKVVKNANWDTCWPASNYEYTVAEDGIYNLVITYNPENDEVIFSCEVPGEEPPVVEITSYTVVGPEAVFGVDWDATAVANDMVKGEDDVYTWTKEEVTLNGNFSFKVVGNHDYAVYEWPMGYGNNYDVTVAEEAIYTIEITFNPEAEENARITCTLTKTSEITPVEHAYTVAGTQNLFGSNWDQTDATNDMVKGEDGIYTWTKKGVEFALNEEVEFKVVQDHAWTYAWPSSNWYWKCEDAGTYDVVITFNAQTKEVTFTATKQTGKVGDITGEGDVNMDDLTALINYLLTNNGEGLNLDNAAACDGAEGVNMDDLTALINYLLTGNWPAPPVVEHTYTVAGTENLFGSNWNPADEANDMVKGNDGIYTWTKENVEFTEYATIEFKVVEDHSWDNSAWPSSNWWAEITEPGMYNFVITFNPAADDMNKITYTATKQVVE